MSARALLCLPLLLVAGMTQAQERPPQPHMEGCLIWSITEGRVVARNECSRPFTILFMSLESGQKIEAEIAPRGWFESGVPAGSTYMFTACPVGYVPSVRFALENETAIVDSLYNCVSGRPNAQIRPGRGRHRDRSRRRAARSAGAAW